MSATPEYYVSNPIDPVQMNGYLSDLLDAPLGDFLAGTSSSVTLQFFFRTFGPTAATNEVNKIISRDGDYAVIDGERFLFEQVTKAQITSFITSQLLLLAAGPEVYIAATVLGVSATTLIWNNFIQPLTAGAEAYLGTAQTRLEMFDSTGNASIGVLYRNGLQGVSEIDAVQALIGRGLDQATIKPEVGSHIDVRVND